MRETKGSLNKEMYHTPVLEDNTVKMPIIPKLIYKFTLS